MKYKNEQQVKDVLGLVDWRNLSKDKIMKFVALMPDMDKEVMMKIIAQFPEFRLLANTVLEYYEQSFREILETNSEDQKDLHNSFDELKKIIEDQLDKEDITFEEKKYYFDKLFELLDKRTQISSENKKFLLDIAKYRVASGGLVLLAALVFVGGKVWLEKDNENERENVINQR